MPQTTDELVQLLELEPEQTTRFIAQPPDTALQRTYGGQVLAQALMAAYQTVPEDRYAHSLHAYFLRSGQPKEPITYQVEKVRDGGTFSSRNIQALQTKSIFQMNASFHRLEESALDHQDPQPENIADPEDCPSLADVMCKRYGQMDIWREWDALDARFIGDSTTGDELAGHRAHMRVWVKTKDRLPDDLRIHQAVLAYLSDLTLLSVSSLPHHIVFLSNKVQIASVDHSIWFHRPGRADEWMLYDQVSPNASHALGFGTGKLFQNGKLIASCAQEGLVRQVENRAVLT